MYLWEGLKNIKPVTLHTLDGIPIKSVTLSRYFNWGGRCNRSDETEDQSHPCRKGQGHGIILTEAGDLFAFGDNTLGQLGIGDCEKHEEETLFIKALTGITVVQVSCGATHTAVLASDGQIFCWGDNCKHQCGPSKQRFLCTPTLIDIVHDTAPCDHVRTNVTGNYQAKMLRVACGDYHTVALSETGDLWSWGFGRALGLLTKSEAVSPVVIPFLQYVRVLNVSCGSRHTVAIVESVSSRSYSTQLAGTSRQSTAEQHKSGRSDSPVLNGIQYHKYRPATCVRCKEEIYTYKDNGDTCVICNKHTCPLGFQVKTRELPAVKGQSKQVTGENEEPAPDNKDDEKKSEQAGEKDFVVDASSTSVTTSVEPRKHPQDLDKVDIRSDDSQSTTSTSQTSPLPTIQLPQVPSSPFMQKMGNFFQMVSNQPAAVQEYMTNITSSVVSNIKTSINKIGLATREEDEAMQRQLSPTPEQLRLFGPMELTDVQVEELPVNIPKSMSSEFSHMEQSRLVPGLLRRITSLPHSLDVIKETGKTFYQNEVVYNTEVWSWGDNDYGQLGHGDTLDRSQPCQIQALNDKSIIEVVTGSHHNIAISALSEVYTWGKNDHKQLGHNKIVTTTPLKIRTLGGAAVWSAAAGDEHSLLLTDSPEFYPDIFYAGKLPSSDPKLSSPDVEQFIYLRTPWQNFWLHELSAGGSMCSCVGDFDPSSQTVTLYEFAATERIFHQQIDLIRSKFLQAMIETANSQNNSQVTTLLQLLEGALTAVCNMVIVNHLELSCVVRHILPLRRIRMFTHWETMVSAFTHYMQCLGSLRVIHGLSLDTKMANLCNEVLRDLGYRPQSQGKSEVDCQQLLEIPLSRVADYRKLLDKLVQSTPVLSSDHHLLNQTGQTWEVLKQSIKTECKLVDNTITFWDTLSSEFGDKIQNLRIPERRLYKHGVMLIVEQRKKDRHFALFNDILVYFKKSAYNVYPLEIIWVEIPPDSKKMSNALLLITPEETLTVIAQDRGEWYCALCEAITNALESKQHHVTIPPQHGSTSALTVPQERQAVYTFVDHPQYKGARYEGRWKCGKVHGEGRMTWADGRNFIGLFKNGSFEYGMFAVPVEGSTPELQIGHWKDWKLHGSGEIRYANGDEFKGHFLDGKRYGHGVMTEEDDTIYIGEWTNDKRNGYGVEVQTTEVYMGLWTDDQKHGGGVMVTLDDLYFEGNFSYNKMTGLGLLITEDGMCYEGQFSGGLFSLSGHGKITFSNGDYIEGRFQGSFTGGININGTLRKGLLNKDTSLFSLDEYKHDVEQRAVCFGKLGVPADRKWADVFSECYGHLGCGLGQKVGEVSTQSVWDEMIRTIREKVEVLDFLTQRELSQDTEGSKNRLSHRLGLVDDLTNIPDMVTDDVLTAQMYEQVKAYLDKAFDCPLHPLGKLMSELVFAFTTTYGGRGLHPRLLHYAVEEVRSFVIRIYEVIRLLFPNLPDQSRSPKPLPPRVGVNEEVLNDTPVDEEVYVTPEDLLHPLLMPELYPTVFNMYALYHAKDDDVYWLRLEKWYKKPDLAIMVYLGIDSRYWRSDSMDFESVDPESPIWKFKEMNTFNNCYTQAVEMLQTISTAYSPMEKLIVLKQTFAEITKSLGEGELVGQDFLFPIFTFIVLRAKIRQLGAEIHFIQDLMEPSLKTGELGHMITDLSASYHYIKNEDDRKSVSHHQ